MLSLSRKVGQDVILELPNGEKIIIKLAKVESKNRARIAFEAPKNVNIVRRELLEK